MNISISEMTFTLFIFLDPPSVTAKPLELVVNHTQMAGFACEAFGIPVPSIIWIKVSDGSVLFTAMDDIEITEEIVDSFTRVSNLSFLNTTRTDRSKYTCVGSNGITNIISSPENATVNLLVQGEFLILASIKYPLNVYQQQGISYL